MLEGVQETAPGGGPPSPAHGHGRSPAPWHRRRRPPLGSRPVLGRLPRGTGGLVITAGVVAVLFVAYELWVTNIVAAHDQHPLRTAIERTWSRPSVTAPQEPTAPREATAPQEPTALKKPTGPAIPRVTFGGGLAILRIPRFGPRYAPVVVEGVAAADLRKGPGHYPGTALPGAIGNFVVSGHRTTYLHPFGDLDRLRIGDPIVVEVADRYYTYLVTQSQVVDPSDLAVILPVPDHPGMIPTHAELTFTTCNPKHSASARLIVHAQLHATTMKARGLPLASREG